MKDLVIEKRNKEVNKVKDTLNYITRTAQNVFDATQRVRDILPSEIKVGHGGSHVWAANQSNERLFIIYL